MLNKQELKQIIKRNALLYKIFTSLRTFYYSNRKIDIKNNGIAKITRYVNGSGNSIFIGKGGIIDDVHIQIVGNNNKIVFGENVRIRKGCSFWMEGNIILK